jgi:geranylgeranyl reductase family protein
VLGPRYIAPYAAVDVPWPDHPVLGTAGYVVRRSVLDQVVADNACEAGAELFDGHEVVCVDTGEDGRVLAVVARADGVERRIEATHFVVSDGSGSRLSRQLGRPRDFSYPIGVAIRGYYPCDADGDWLDSFLDLRLQGHKTIPGYGWAFPTGDGRINVGIGVLSTYKHWKDLNTTELMNEFVRDCVLPRWPIDPAALTSLKGGKLPIGGSVDPAFGPNFVLAGDAAGLINPFNGEGISYALESGRVAGDVVASVLACEGSLVDYPVEVHRRLGGYYRAGLFMLNVVGNPFVLREMMRLGMQSKSLMEWATRILCNLVREDEPMKGGEFALGLLDKGLRLGVLRGGRQMKMAAYKDGDPGDVLGRALDAAAEDEPTLEVGPVATAVGR